MPKYTEAKLLTDGSGNPIPQWLDPTDTTDSPQGTFKPMSKEVSIGNFPATQPVSGSVNVGNFPAKQDVQLTGSLTSLASDPKPVGEEGNTLLEYDETTGETTVYKYISGDWRAL